MAIKALCGAVCSSPLPVHRPAHFQKVSTHCSNRCRPSRLQQWRIRAGSPGPSTNQRSSTSTNGTPPSIIKESDLSFLGKLVVASFAGAALIKYGSLLISLPFEPNAVVALAVVLGTPGFILPVPTDTEAAVASCYGVEPAEDAALARVSLQPVAGEHGGKLKKKKKKKLPAPAKGPWVSSLSEAQPLWSTGLSETKAPSNTSGTNASMRMPMLL